jgi:hypothetical protein
LINSGVQHLKSRLGKIQYQKIKQNSPKLLKTIQQRLLDANEMLFKLGKKLTPQKLLQEVQQEMKKKNILIE